jgi:hypothetical protein
LQTCPPGEVSFCTIVHANALLLPDDIGVHLMYLEIRRRWNFLDLHFVKRLEMNLGREVQMYAKERALEQANLFVTMVLVLLLMAGIIVVGLTAALSYEGASSSDVSHAPSTANFSPEVFSTYVSSDVEVFSAI